MLYAAIPEILAVMTVDAQAIRLFQQQGTKGGTVALVAAETVSITGRRVQTYRFVVAPHLLMALNAYLVRGFGEQCLEITGMDGMTGGTFTLQYRRMGVGLTPGLGVMAGATGTRGIGNRKKRALGIFLVTGNTITSGHRVVHMDLQQPGADGTMRGMTLNAPGCDRKTEMTLHHGRGTPVMTGEADILFYKKSRISGGMGIVTGLAAIGDGLVDVRPGKFLGVMAGITGPIAGGFQKVGIGAVVHLVAGGAFTLLDRLMHRATFLLRLHGAVTGVTEIRFNHAKLGAADKTVAKMAGAAVVFSHRLMDITGEIPLLHLDMAVDAFLAGP